MKSKHLSRKKAILLVSLFFLIAVGLCLYPFLSNYIVEHQTDSLVHTVEQDVEQVDNTEKETAFAEAKKYNEVITSGVVKLQDPFTMSVSSVAVANYRSLLNITKDGVMGLIKIPAIDVSLPIYHGTSDAVLEKGVGHLEGTSLPIGGSGTHIVLTGHSGLSKAKLFTDLDNLQIGDYFFLETWGETLSYRVESKKVILPSELDDLQVVQGEDLCTLLTCTPYGVNSHRLLVRGVRAELPDIEEEQQEVVQVHDSPSRWMMEYKSALLIGFGFFCLGLAGILGYPYYRNKKQNRRDRT